MSPNLRRVLFAVVGLLLLATPLILRTTVWQYNERNYFPGDVSALNQAATPVPTETPAPASTAALDIAQELPAGPVVVDLAHGNRISRAAFEPLAAALAERGVGLRFWLGSVDLLAINSFYDFPDQSAELRPLLDEAAALVVVSPFFLWSPQEIALVERFVARGGRLLLVSDPDILGDLAQDINNLAEPFGVVFHDDYLYNTVHNDGNFVHIFQDYFVDQAADLADATVALYGARSLGGDVMPQVRTGDNVLSSMRTGVIHFDTVAIGGVDARGTQGRVLAMTDFDVLTQPYVLRHDNTRLLEFAAEFLAAGQMRDHVIDFPAFLGREVALVFGNDAAVDASVLLQGARLQQSLETTGRSLALVGTGALTATLDTQLMAAPTPEPTLDVLDEEETPRAPAREGQDWLVLADYELADETSLLADLGFALVEVTATPTPTLEADIADEVEDEAEDVTPEPEATPFPPDVTPTPENGDDESEDDGDESENGVNEDNDGDARDAGDENNDENGDEEDETTPGVTADLRVQAEETPTAPDAGEEITPTVTITSTVTVTVTATPTSTAEMTPTVMPGATPTPTPEPEVTVYLRRDDGLRLLAAQTVLIAQRELADGQRLVAILGHDAAGISAGVDRLLERNYEGCITGEALVVCSYADGEPVPSPVTTPAPLAPDVTPGPPLPEPPPPTDPDPMRTPAPSPQPPDAPPDAPTTSVLIVDDNANAVEGERNEADIYLQMLVSQGLTPDLWSTAVQGAPTSRELLAYTWVIWSAGGYEGGGPDLNALDSLLGYINEGGRLTISSRRPFFGMSGEDASVIVDIEVDTDIPALITGLPSEPFSIEAGLPPVIPLEVNARENGPRVALRRGPESGSPGAPLLFVVDDADEEDATGARLMILGMSLTWFTDGHERTLVTNMAPVMLGD